MNYKEKSLDKQKREFVELIKEKEKLKKEIRIAKLNLLKLGIKEEDLRQLGILQKSNKLESLNKRPKPILDRQHKTPRDFTIKPIHPGEILLEELLIPRNISPEELAKEINVPKEMVK